MNFEVGIFNISGLRNDSFVIDEEGEKWMRNNLKDETRSKLEREQALQREKLKAVSKQLSMLAGSRETLNGNIVSYYCMQLDIKTCIGGSRKSG